MAIVTGEGRLIIPRGSLLEEATYDTLCPADLMAMDGKREALAECASNPRLWAQIWGKPGLENPEEHYGAFLPYPAAVDLSMTPENQISDLARQGIITPDRDERRDYREIDAVGIMIRHLRVEALTQLAEHGALNLTKDDLLSVAELPLWDPNPWGALSDLAQRTADTLRLLTTVLPFETAGADDPLERKALVIAGHPLTAVAGRWKAVVSKGRHANAVAEIAVACLDAAPLTGNGMEWVWEGGVIPMSSAPFASYSNYETTNSLLALSIGMAGGSDDPWATLRRMKAPPPTLPAEIRILSEAFEFASPSAEDSDWALGFVESVYATFPSPESWAKAALNPEIIETRLRKVKANCQIAMTTQATKATEKGRSKNRLGMSKK